ncbi:MAG: hypothetical protein ACYC7E_09475 [Armatimonadota bacterium]
MLRVGFAERDITPPVGTHKIGWLKDIIIESVLDPLFVHAAVFQSDGPAIGVIQLDTLSIRWSHVQDIRGRVTERYGFPGDNIMVTATHNHAGPAVANVGDVPRDEAYVETLTQACVATFGEALERRQPAAVGFEQTFEWAVAHNRRVVMRDGTARTHYHFNDPDSLYLEGPIDPEVAVLAARGKDGALLGCLVNFTCHPTHHGGDTIASAGYPGVLAAEMKKRGCPVTLFLNGACGNVHTSDPVRGTGMEMEEAGQRLAADAERVLARMIFSTDIPLAASKRTVMLPYRTVTDDEVRGTVHGAQRFGDPNWYDRSMPALQARIEERGMQPAEVQVLALGNVAIAGIPAEYFVEYGLRIKIDSYPCHALVAGHTNGMVGYVPTRESLARGGYETTFSPAHRLGPDAGDLLADAAVAIIKEMSAQEVAAK